MAEATSSSRIRLFTVRMWSETVGDSVEHRGSVRDVTTGAFRSFREWSGLTSFLAERMDEESRSRERQHPR